MGLAGWLLAALAFAQGSPSAREKTFRAGAHQVDISPAGEKTVFIGGRCDNYANFEGKVDEVAVYPRALKPEEIGAHFKVSGISAPAAVSVNP